MDQPPNNRMMQREEVTRRKASSSDVLGGTCQCVLCNKTVNTTEAYALHRFEPVCQECYQTARADIP